MSGEQSKRFNTSICHYYLATNACLVLPEDGKMSLRYEIVRVKGRIITGNLGFGKVVTRQTRIRDNTRKHWKEIKEIKEKV